MDENWVILTNGSTVIGLFQGMFEGNILTFNPGWEATTGPAHTVLTDPDGNTIMVDQHR